MYDCELENFFKLNQVNEYNKKNKLNRVAICEENKEKILNIINESTTITEVTNKLGYMEFSYVWPLIENLLKEYNINKKFMEEKNHLIKNRIPIELKYKNEILDKIKNVTSLKEAMINIGWSPNTRNVKKLKFFLELIQSDFLKKIVDNKQKHTKTNNNRVFLTIDNLEKIKILAQSCHSKKELIEKLGYKCHSEIRIRLNKYLNEYNISIQIPTRNQKIQEKIKNIEITEENKEKIKNIIEKCSTWTGISKALNIKWEEMEEFEENIKKFNLEISHLPRFKNKPRQSVFADKEKLEEITKNSINLAEILKAYNYRNSKKAYDTLMYYLEYHKIDYSYLSKDNKRAFIKKRTYEEVICENSEVTGTVLRKFILRNNLLPYECAIPECPTHLYKDNWAGRGTFSFELDHINTNPRDNRLENLRFLCPICHRQTEGHGAKGIKVKKRKNNNEI